MSISRSEKVEFNARFRALNNKMQLHIKAIARNERPDLIDSLYQLLDEGEKQFGIEAAKDLLSWMEEIWRDESPFSKKIINEIDGQYRLKTPFLEVSTRLPSFVTSLLEQKIDPDALSKNALGDDYKASGDLILAFNCYHAAAQWGYAEAQYNVAVCFEEGVGVEKIPIMAQEWYGKAARQGHSEAKRRLTVLKLLPEDKEPLSSTSSILSSQRLVRQKSNVQEPIQEKKELPKKQLDAEKLGMAYEKHKQIEEEERFYSTFGESKRLSPLDITPSPKHEENITEGLLVVRIGSESYIQIRMREEITIVELKKRLQAEIVNGLKIDEYTIKEVGGRLYQDHEEITLEQIHDSVFELVKKKSEEKLRAPIKRKIMSSKELMNWVLHIEPSFDNFVEAIERYIDARNNRCFLYGLFGRLNKAVKVGAAQKVLQCLAGDEPDFMPLDYLALGDSDLGKILFKFKQHLPKAILNSIEHAKEEERTNSCWPF